MAANAARQVACLQKVSIPPQEEVIYAGMVADKPPEVSKAEVTGKLAQLKAMLNQSVEGRQGRRGYTRPFQNGLFPANRFHALPSSINRPA